MNHTKLLLIVIGIAFSFHTIHGQSANTEFFMRSSFTNTSLNPAKRPDKGYIGFPGLTNLSVNYRTNTFTLDNFLYPGLGEDGKSAWFLNKNVSTSRFLKEISDYNQMHMNLDYTPIGFGFYVKDLFLFFDASFRTSSDLNIPGDAFRLLKKGVALNIDDEGKTYDLSNTNADALAYTQIGFGGSYPILNNSLVIGTKLKILMGHARIRLNTDKLLLNVGQNQWTMQSQASMQVVGLSATYDEDGVFDGFDDDTPSIMNGSGFGFDLGATFKPEKYFEFTEDYTFMNNVTFSAALTDVGYIKWNKSKASYLRTDEASIDIIGNHNISFEENSEQSLSEIIESLSDRFEDAIKLKEDPNNTKINSSGIRAKLNWGIEYALLEEKINTGILLTSYFNPIKTNTELTLAGAYRPARGFEVGLSYSFIPSYYQSFEFALHFGPGFHITSNYGIFPVNGDGIPVRTNAFNLQFGVAIPIGAKH